MTTLILSNIGTIVSGRVDDPIIAGDTIVAEDGLIAFAGFSQEMPSQFSDQNHLVIDVLGTTVIPGLIDNHVHPVLGDYSPRQQIIGFIESCLHGGVTSMISAGEPHTPGRPKTAVGTKSLAILAAQSFANLRPGGVKVMAGAVILAEGLEASDFDEMAEAGVQLVGEIGLSSLYTAADAGPMVKWARERGMRVQMHTGGASIPGSSAIGADAVCAIRPDVASHVNGGPTRLPLADVERILHETDAFVEIVQCGNVLAAKETAELVERLGLVHRLVLGTDMPSGTGVVPLGMLRTISWVSALGGIAPAVAIGTATGNTARLHRLNRGVIEVGREVDLVILDAPVGSIAGSALDALACGDTPAVAGVIIDGNIRCGTSRNTPAPQRPVAVPGFGGAAH